MCFIHQHDEGSLDADRDELLRRAPESRWCWVGFRHLTIIPPQPESAPAASKTRPEPRFASIAGEAPSRFELLYEALQASA